MDEKYNKKGTSIKVSIIVPVFDESEIIVEFLEGLFALDGISNSEVIVVDGNPEKPTITNIPDKYALIKLFSAPGRAIQMNRGAEVATGGILFFLHSDSVLNEKALFNLQHLPSQYRAGAFSFKFIEEDKKLRHIALWANIRSYVFHLPFGDQGIFIRKELFEEMEGFTKIPLMEDVNLMQRLKKRKIKPIIINRAIQTSARKYLENGVFKNSWKNLFLQFLFFLKVPASTLRDIYYGEMKFKKLFIELFRIFTKHKHTSATILFTKYPEKGKVKTRLAKDIGDEEATEFYRRNILKVSSEANKINSTNYIFFKDAKNGKRIKNLFGNRFMYSLQRGNGLGEKMANAFTEIFSKEYHKVILFGGDIPEIDTQILEESLNKLDDFDAVIGPTFDGGYYLIGFNSEKFKQNIFFGYEYSNDKVFDNTINKFAENGLRYYVLKVLRDIDRKEDLANWKS